MKPRVEITVDGKPVAGTFYERLVSLTVTDKEGVTSDSFDIELYDVGPNFLAIPRKGASVDIRIGYGTALRSLGKFTVDRVTVAFLPYSMKISGKSADLRKGKLKEKKERHWDDKTVKQIVEQVASENGLSAKVGEEAGAHQYDWLGQQDETDIAFLERLAKRHNALFSIKGGNLVFADRGSGQATTGESLGTVVVTPPIIVLGSGSYEANDRTQYSKVVAYHQDRETAKREEVEEEADEDGDSTFRLTEPYADKKEARKAAKAKAKQLKRGEGAMSVQVIGDNSIIAGAPLVFEGVRPGIDGVPFVIDTATHSFSKSSGYVTAISAKLYDGKSAKKKAAKSSTSTSSASGSDTADSATSDTPTPEPKPAANSAPGTPAVPSAWTGRRNGLTDQN